jgi:hypothetical protein
MDRPMTLAVRGPDLSTVGEPDYANVVHVSYTPYDFRVTFSLLMTPHEQGAALPPGGSLAALTPRAVREVVLPASAVESLIDVLQAQLDEFVGRYGPVEPSVRQSDGHPAMSR